MGRVYDKITVKCCKCERVFRIYKAEVRKVDNDVYTLRCPYCRCWLEGKEKKTKGK